jgi:hypothetical protein
MALFVVVLWPQRLSLLNTTRSVKNEDFFLEILTNSVLKTISLSDMDCKNDLAYFILIVDEDGGADKAEPAADDVVEQELAESG